MLDMVYDHGPPLLKVPGKKDVTILESIGMLQTCCQNLFGK